MYRGKIDSLEHGSTQFKVDGEVIRSRIESLRAEIDLLKDGLCAQVTKTNNLQINFDSLSAYFQTNIAIAINDITNLKIRVTALEEANTACEGHSKKLSDQIAALQLSVVIFKQLIGKEHEHDVDVLNELNKVIKKTTEELNVKITNLQVSIGSLEEKCEKGCGKVGGGVDPSILNEINIRIDKLEAEACRAADCKKAFD